MSKSASEALTDTEHHAALGDRPDVLVASNSRC